jgi:hypothetical protein
MVPYSVPTSYRRQGPLLATPKTAAKLGGLRAHGNGHEIDVMADGQAPALMRNRYVTTLFRCRYVTG